MLVSVIVPVYNSENFLDKCIQSILNQDFEGFELILVNDGSTDNSGRICDSYVERDSRVKVYHKANGGVSSARNVGIEKAIGNWITFVDSDDYIEKEYFQALLDQSVVDLIMQGSNYFDKEIKVKEVTYSQDILSRYELISRHHLYPDFSSSWAKFYKKSVINTNHLRFQENISFGEDSIFTLEYLLLCENILLTDSSRYNYRLSEGGLTKKKLDFKHDFLFYKVIKDVLEKFEHKIFFDNSIIIPLNRFINSIFSDKTLSRPERQRLLKQTIVENYGVIFRIYTDPKIKVIIILCYYTGSYFLLETLLYRTAK